MCTSPGKCPDAPVPLKFTEEDYRVALRLAFTAVGGDQPSVRQLNAVARRLVAYFEDDAAPMRD